MALHKILVIDDSPAVLETVRTVLGADYQVTSLACADFERIEAPAVPLVDLILLGDRAAQIAQHSPSSVPTLPLHEEPAVRSATGRPASNRAVSRSISPPTLRRRVRAALAAPREDFPDADQAWLETPRLTAEAALVVSRATACHLPVFLIGEPGVGKRSVARAIHRRTETGPFVCAEGRSFAAHPLLFSDAPSRGTLFVSGVDRLSPDGQDRLAAMFEANGLATTPEGVMFRLITAASDELDEALDAGTFPRELYHRLAVLAVRLPPLRDRVEEIPAIAARIAADHCRALRLSSVSFTPRALDRLARYLWPGNIAELDTVVARTLAIRRPEVIDAGDLLFDGSPLTPPPPVPNETKPLTNLARGLGGHALELIINELAHEFKNPMVTVKTFAHQLQRSGPVDPDQQQLARLTTDAVDQMNGAVDNLVEFTHLHAPGRTPVLLAALLAEPLTELAEDVAAHGAHLDDAPPPSVTIVADPAQIAYALRNLLRTLAQKLGPNDTVAVTYRQPATVVITASAWRTALTGHLAALIDAAAAAESPLPLGAVIARAVIELNGGTLEVDRQADPPAVTVTFVPAHREEEQVAGNGKSPRSDR